MGAVMGGQVVDHERITRNFPEGRGTLEILCVYEVQEGRIRRARFALGATPLERPGLPGRLQTLAGEAPRAAHSDMGRRKRAS